MLLMISMEITIVTGDSILDKISEKFSLIGFWEE